MRKVAALFALFSFAASGLSQSRRFSADDLTKIVRISDQQISPDGKTISIVVGRANLKEDRWDSEIDFVDVATKQLRVMTHDRAGAGSVRWSPTGDRIAYLAQDGEKKAQIFVMPVNGGESVQLTHSKTPVTVIAWRPDGQALAYAAADEEPERKDEAKFEDAFEVGNNSYLERAAARPVHLWTVTTSGRGEAADVGELVAAGAYGAERASVADCVYAGWTVDCVCAGGVADYGRRGYGAVADCGCGDGSDACVDEERSGGGESDAVARWCAGGVCVVARWKARRTRRPSMLLPVAGGAGRDVALRWTGELAVRRGCRMGRRC